MRAVFRVDGSPSVGMGHVMRCMSLAKALRGLGVSSCFVCQDAPGAAWRDIQSNGFDVHLIPTGLDELSDAIACLGCAALAVEPDLVVVDVYALSAVWESAIRGRTRCLAVVDDLADRAHVCDVLIDQNLHEQARGRYQGKVREDALYLLGPAYALLREEFAQTRLRTAPRQGLLHKLALFFTAGDDQGETLKAMRGLALLDLSAAVHVVIGRGHADPQGVAALCASQGWHFHCQIDAMAELFRDVDLAVGACGSASWERCALGVPALACILAENQADLTRSLAASGVVRSLGWHQALSPRDYADAVSSLSAQQLASMSLAAWRLVDGAGAYRAAASIIEFIDTGRVAA